MGMSLRGLLHKEALSDARAALPPTSAPPLRAWSTPLKGSASRLVLAAALSLACADRPELRKHKLSVRAYGRRVHLLYCLPAGAQ